MHPIFNKTSMCNIPAFFYPTTILLVDDDEQFLKMLASELKKYYRTVTFTNPSQAIDFLSQKEDGFLFRERAILERYEKNGILEFRKELLNEKRFEDVLVSVLDYDMPEKTGFDIWWGVGTNDFYQGYGHKHSYILLTAKRYAELDEKTASDNIGKNFISKHDPKHLEYLLENINQLSSSLFRAANFPLANVLTHDSKEKTSFLNDSNFLPVFNAYLKEHSIVEGYLFDKQGSLIMLDQHAKSHWLFIRNNNGIANSILMAKQYSAPQSVIETLESKENILSLYEKEDFESRKSIDWDKYLFKATVFKDEHKIEVFNHCPSDYYYAFTEHFPDNSIDMSKVLSYAAFLKK